MLLGWGRLDNDDDGDDDDGDDGGDGDGDDGGHGFVDEEEQFNCVQKHLTLAYCP